MTLLKDLLTRRNPGNLLSFPVRTVSLGRRFTGKGGLYGRGGSGERTKTEELLYAPPHLTDGGPFPQPTHKTSTVGDGGWRVKGDRPSPDERDPITDGPVHRFTRVSDLSPNLKTTTNPRRDPWDSPTPLVHPGSPLPLYPPHRTQDDRIS